MRSPAAILVGFLLLVSCGDDAPSSEEGEASDQSDASDGDDQRAEGEVVFEDTFDTNESGWLPSEAAGPDEGGTYEVPGSAGLTVTLDGALTYATDGRSDIEVFLQWPDELTPAMDEISDVRVEADVSAVSPGTPVLACRILRDGEAPRYYAFTLSSSGAYQINESAADGEISVVATEPPEIADQLGDDRPGLPEFEPAFEFEDDRTYEMAVECTGGRDGEPATLTLFVDGEEVLSAEDADDPIPSGVAGVSPTVSAVAQASSDDEGYEITYDDLRIIDLVP